VTALQLLKEALAPHGWTVTDASSIPYADGWAVRFEHELTTEKISHFSREPTDKEAAGVLEDREFHLIAQRPEMVHASLIGGIRRSSLALGLHKNGVEVIALVLRNEGVLTEDEADWLYRAGLPWMPDGDRPRDGQGNTE
jgi:hypothetical protein